MNQNQIKPNHIQRYLDQGSMDRPIKEQDRHIESKEIFHTFSTFYVTGLFHDGTVLNGTVSDGAFLDGTVMKDKKALPIVNKDIIRNMVWDHLDSANLVRFPR